MGLESVCRKLVEAEVAGVRGGSDSALRAGDVRGLQGSCRGQAPTSASASVGISDGYERHAEVAGVSDSFTHAQAHVRAHTRARKQSIDTGRLQPMQPLHAPAPSLAVTILKHCRCIDCRHWIKPPYSMCRHGVIVNGMGGAFEYPPDAWHYCALYHGPQASPDVWAWPHGVEGVVGPSGGSDGCDRGGNGSLPGLFRSTARAQPAGQPNKEA